MMKNKIFFLITVTILFGMVFFVRAEEIEILPEYVVFLIDTSEEMNSIDPERVALNAVAELIESGAFTDYTGICIIGFSDRVTTIPFARLENQSVIADFRRGLSAFQYSGEESDVDLALRVAENAFSNLNIPHIPMIILISSREISDEILANVNFPLFGFEVNDENIHELPSSLMGLYFTEIPITLPYRSPLQIPSPTPSSTPEPEEIFEEEIPEEEIPE
ncbi:MAG: VWA domain-containing protein, partial [Clostridiales bacterium]|nr:VWA domain-containing protein [Clostridiales bacterium]